MNHIAKVVVIPQPYKVALLTWQKIPAYVIGE